MSHTKLHWLYQRLEHYNDALVPGRGKVFGLNPKYDIISPVDAIPVVGPLNKLNKLWKLSKVSKGRWLLLGSNMLWDYLLVKEGYGYLTRRQGSGAPLTSTPTAPTKAISRSSESRSSCPRGMRWDRRKGKCVRINRR